MRTKIQNGMLICTLSVYASNRWSAEPGEAVSLLSSWRLRKRHISRVILAYEQKRPRLKTSLVVIVSAKLSRQKGAILEVFDTSKPDPMKWN